jgi:hypothetical protein
VLRACTLHQIDRKQVLSQAKNVFRGLGATTSSLVGFRAARPLVHFRGAAHGAFRSEKSTHTSAFTAERKCLMLWDEGVGQQTAGLPL